MLYLCDSKRHIICQPYSIENLHRMAEQLNIGRHWYHQGKFPHYDIPQKRIEEITKKFNLITSKQLLTIIKNENN